MPDNTLPKPEQVLGGSKLPSPNQVLDSGMPAGQAAYESAFAQDDTNQFEQVLTNIPDINETQKSNLRKLALNVKEGKASHEDLRDTILTYQNKHPKQSESGKYYITENMTAKPLASDERPPKGYDVANDYWGTQEEADKKGLLASAGSHLYNGVLKGVLGLEGLANLPYGMATGQDADWYKAAQNRVESSLMKTPGYEHEKELFDAKDVKGIGDFFDSKRYNFDANTVQGAALSGLESITSFLVGTKGFGAAGTALSAAGKGSKVLTAGGKTGAFLEGTTSAGAKAQALGGAYAITLPEVLQYVDDAGIKGEDKYRLSAAIAVPMALTEMIGGTEALFAKNAAAKQSKSAVIKGVVDAVKRNTDGPLTKEFLTETFKATTKEAAQLNKSFVRELGENVLGEAATEGLQEFEKQGLAELYDHISKEDNFKKNPLSLEAFGEYYNSALQGGLGSIGAGAVGTMQKRSIDLHEKQSGNIFEVVKNGESSVNALKENVAKSVADGEITKEQADELLFKVDAYDAYNKQTSDMALEDNDKKKIFELTFEKSNLDSQIPTEYEQKNLNAIEQAKIDAKKKQSKDIQNEINEIILKNELLNKSTVAAKKTVSDVDKKIEAENEPEVTTEGKRPTTKFLRDLSDKFREEELGAAETAKPEKKVVKIDERPYEAIPPVDWNTKKHAEKFTILKDKLVNENDTILGNLTLQSGGQGKITNDTIHIEMPGKKFVITASSAKDLQTKLRGHFKTEFVKEENIDKHPVIIKPLQLTSGKTVLGVYGEESGRFISYVRENETGKSKYSDQEIDELQHLQAASKLTKAELEYYKQKRNQPPTDEGEAGATNIVPTKPVTPTSPEGQAIINETAETGPVREPKQGAKEVSKEGKETTNKTKEKTVNDGKEQTTRTEGAEQGDVSETDGKSTKPGKETKLRTGTKRNVQKIKSPIRRKAVSHEVFDPYHAALQYFAGKGNISTEAIQKLYKGSQKEVFARNVYTRAAKNVGDKVAPSLESVAQILFDEYIDTIPNATVEDYLNAVELAVQKNLTRNDMAAELNAVMEEGEQVVPTEGEVLMDIASEEAEKAGADKEFEAVTTQLEKLPTSELEKLAESDEEFNKWEEQNDIVIRKDLEGDVFQKEVDVKAKQEVIIKIVDKLKKSMPKVNVVYDENLKQAGLFSPKENTIYVNPLRSGLDTPIHEYGHVFIDTIGYDNKIIQAAIKQLKGTDLWNSTKERYDELDERDLGIEVLAEAIGLEGAGIFDKESEKNTFMKYLEYIFDWLKRNLGLEKNIAKNLAKQIIAGIGTSEMEGVGSVVKEQKEKGKRKKYHEKSEKQRAFERNLNITQYRKKKFDAVPEEEVRNLKELDRIISDENSNPDDVEIAAGFKSRILRKIKREESAYYQYLDDLKIADLYDKELSEGVDEKRLGEIINELYLLQPEAAEEAQNRAKLMLAYGMFSRRKQELKKNEKFIEEVANRSDIDAKDVLMKNLGHMTEAVPELQGFSKIFDKTHLDMAEERKELKNTFEKLGLAVIKETNKKLGLTGKALSVFSSDSAKYFEYLDDGKGNLLTEEQAKKKGLSDAQIAFLKNYRDLVTTGNNIVEDVYNQELEVLKTDPTFAEAFKMNGIVDAMSHLLGNSYNLKKTRIPFENPNTGIREVADFQTIENEIIKYSKKGAIEKAKALALLIHNNFKAKHQLRKGVNYDEASHPLELKDSGEYSVDYKGELVGKFGRPRDKNRGYSKDFYRAGIEFIDELTHTKHMSPLVPIINGIEFLNEKGFKEHAKKPEVVKWIQQWRDMHLFKNTKQTLPEIDIPLKFLRFMTSATTMMFNVPASAMNLFMGLYNNWRAENGAMVAIGHKRLFGEIGKHKVNKDYGFGTINPYAVDILRKFDVVSIDYDSNPKEYIGRIFENLGHGLTRYGEFQIQGSMFLGQLTPEEYNSFEYKKNKYGVDELVFKDNLSEADIEKLKDKFISYKNRVSDIQGKYGEKDRRNIMNTELGKSVLQFKVWIPDWYKERFGKEYINADGQTVRGSWKSFYGEGFRQLREAIRKEGFVKAVWNDKGAMSNIKGMLAVATLLVLKYSDDDDEKKRRNALSLDSAMGNLLFIFDPDQLKYTLKNPIAAVGTTEKFINALEAMMDMDAEKTGKAIVRLTPAYKVQKSVEEISRLTE